MHRRFYKLIPRYLIACEKAIEAASGKGKWSVNCKSVLKGSPKGMRRIVNAILETEGYAIMRSGAISWKF